MPSAPGATRDASAQAGSRRPTIRDVARVAGVSHQTVARYLRQDPRINAASQERIAAAITQLDYRPNLVARAMRDGRTGRLALLLPSGGAVSSLEMLAGARAAAHEAGYVVELVTLDETGHGRARRVLELADSGLFEGVVSLTALVEDLPAGTRGPIVVCPHYDEQMRGIGELAHAGRIADLVERLAADGHRRFLHLAGRYVHASARARRQAYLDTIDRLGLESHGVVDCDWRAEPARRAVLELPDDSGVTAIIGANDLLAAGALGGAVRRGWDVPGRLSITGWDDTPLAGAISPALTTVSVDHERLGRRAVAQLLAALSGDPAPEDREPITQVIWRESTGPAPGTGADPTPPTVP